MTTIKNRLTQKEWGELGAHISLMEDPTFDDFVKWKISGLVEKHGSPLVLLSVSELWMRLFGVPSGSARARMEAVTGYLAHVAD